MAKNKVSEWSAVPANNTDIGGIDIAEGCAPSGINNAIREMMAQVKDMVTGADGDSQVIGGTLTLSNELISNGSAGSAGQFLTSRGAGLSPQYTTVNNFVTGMIMLWSGSSASIPSGWLLCDGSNSTPDLRNRFVVGAFADDSGVAKAKLIQSVVSAGSFVSGTSYVIQTLGTTDFTLIGASSNTVGVTFTATGTGSGTGTAITSDTVYTQSGGSKDAIVVSHTHSITDSGHSHNNNAGVQAGGGGGVVSAPPQSVGAGSANTSTATTGISINSTGSSGTNANLPPYYALCYIMKS
jgi:hypothetical protein